MLETPEDHDKLRNARLEARISSDQKDLSEHAAALSGRPLSEQVINSTREATPKIVQEHEVICLAREEQVAFVNALLTHSEPGARIQKAVQRYRRKAGL